MAVYQELVNFEEVFSQLTTPPMIINDILTSSEEERDKLRTIIQKNYNNDIMSNLPQCEGGHIVGEYNLGRFCKQCNTSVSTPLHNNLESLLWVRSPEGVAKLINPNIWLILNKRFNKSGFEIIKYLTNTAYKTTARMPNILNDLEHAGITRGYNHFVDNFFFIIEFLSNHPLYRLPKGREDDVLKLINNNRELIFTKYLPLPNRSLLVIEENPTGTYVDPGIIPAIDAIQTVAGIDTDSKISSSWVKERLTVKMINELATFYLNNYKVLFSKKTGIFRKHVYGTRSHFSFRSVISSITDTHEYDCLYIPWTTAIGVLRIHILNKLHKRGYLPNQSLALLTQYATRYHPLLDEIFNELISESKYKGIPCTLNRPPTLARGSIQLLYITKIKTDPDDNTIGMSINIVRAMNADFNHMCIFTKL